MSTKVTQNLTVNLIEKELITVDLVEKYLIAVDLHTADIATKTLGGLKDVDIVDILNNQMLAYDSTTGLWHNLSLTDIALQTITAYGVEPTPVDPLPSKRFRTPEDYKTFALRVYLNGIREKNITIHSQTEFSFGIDIIDDDEVIVDYIKD